MQKKVTSPLDLKPGRSLSIEHPTHGPVCIGVIGAVDTITSGGEWLSLVSLSKFYFDQPYVLISRCEDCWSVSDSGAGVLAGAPVRVGDIIRGH